MGTEISGKGIAEESPKWTTVGPEPSFLFFDVMNSRGAIRACGIVGVSFLALSLFFCHFPLCVSGLQAPRWCEQSRLEWS